MQSSCNQVGLQWARLHRRAGAGLQGSSGPGAGGAKWLQGSYIGGLHAPVTLPHGAGPAGASGAGAAGAGLGPGYIRGPVAGP